MRTGPVIVMLFIVFALTPCVGLAGQAVDVENVNTPLTLPELLGEGGIDTVDIDFWLRIKASANNRPMSDRFMHWLVKPVDGQLVFTVDTGTASGQDHRRAITTYSQAGNLTAYQQTSHERGKKISELTGEVVDGQLVIKTTSFDKETGQATGTTTSTQSLEAFESTLPSEWFSLVAAYHIRKGSLSYEFARTDLAYHFQHASTSIEDVGAETIEYEGKQVTARLLLGERTFGTKDKDNIDSHLQYLVLPNGEMMYMRNQYHSYLFLGRRVSRDELEEDFWLLPLEAEGQEPQEEQAQD